MFKELPRLGASTRHGSFAATQFLGGFSTAFTFEATKYEGGTILLRKAVQLGVQDGLRLAQSRGGRRNVLRASSCLDRIPTESSSCSFGVHGNPKSNSVQPTRH